MPNMIVTLLGPTYFCMRSPLTEAVDKIPTQPNSAMELQLQELKLQAMQL